MSVKTSASGSIKPDKNVLRISTEGDIRLKLITLVVVGIILVVIAIGGVYGIITTQGAFDKYWQGLQTMLSGGLFGLIGFIAGRASRGES